MRLASVVSRIIKVQSGMVTAELALAIPSLALVLALLLAVLGAASDVARASDAARSAARAASIGTAESDVIAAATRLAPANAEISVAIEGGWARVTVDVAPRTLGPFSLPSPTVTGSAPLDAGVTR